MPDQNKDRLRDILKRVKKAREWKDGKDRKVTELAKEAERMEK